jgi:ubiquinone/menaquinone biosynthesis C-methylase UbiE
MQYDGRVRTALASLLAALAAAAIPGAQTRPAHARLFPPDQLNLLEGPDRDEWQQPDRIMDELGIADGSRVADLGAGGGWFTERLAHRVGPNGIVYAEDIQPKMIEAIQRRVESRSLKNVKTILGTADDPKLQPGLNAVLMVDTYPQLQNPVNLLKKIARALAPNGTLGVVDFKPDGGGGPGPPIEERLDPRVIERDAAAAGLTLRRHATFLRYQYLLVFGK